MLDHAGVSERGPVRKSNEDFLAHHVPEDASVRLRKGSLFVVADGVGGSQSGDIASREAARALLESYYQSAKPAGPALKAAFQRANHRILDLSYDGGKHRRMETTLVAVAVVGDRVHIGHVGDTRVYRFRESTGEVTLLTRDHSEVAELVRMGILTAEEARRHPRQNVITRSIGSRMAVQVDYRVETVLPGDTFLLCTDGLWDPLCECDIASLIPGHTAQVACQRLTELALERKTNDNLSAYVVKVLKLEGAIPSEAKEQSSRSFLTHLFAAIRRGRTV